LERFLETHAEKLASAGIELVVAGRMRAQDKARLERRFARTTILGEVDATEPLFDSARLAVMIDKAGGGFKMSFLNYAFSRVPVVALRSALDPSVLQSGCLVAENDDQLVATVQSAIDDFPRLDQVQQAQFNAVQPYL